MLRALDFIAAGLFSANLCLWTGYTIPALCQPFPS